MVVEFHPNVTRAQETQSLSSVQKTPVINSRFESTLAGDDTKTESKGFFAKAFYCISYPFVKIAQFVKWIVCCCRKGETSGKIEPKVDVLKALVSEGQEATTASAKEQAKDATEFFKNLLDNCLADPERMAKALGDKQTEIGEFATAFTKAVKAGDPVLLPGGEEIAYSEKFLIDNASTGAEALKNGAAVISAALGEIKDSDHAQIKDLKTFFATFLPAVAEALKADPAAYEGVLRTLLQENETQLRAFVQALSNTIPEVASLDGHEAAQRLVKTLRVVNNRLGSLDRDLREGHNTLGLEKPIHEVVKYASLEAVFVTHFKAALTPAQIDELTGALIGKKPHRVREAIVFDRLKELPGTADRAEALRVYEDYRAVLGM